jgi:7,8-didemethyl-8-hydroxy-5-deazariboflavin synthase CofG subunit
LALNSSTTDLPSKSLTLNDAIKFLYQEDTNEIIDWRNSALSIANKYYNHFITYTTNLFIPLTFLCRNTCDYCGFRRSKITLGNEYLEPRKIDKILESGKNFKVSEVLITLGERPEEKYPNARKWLVKHGFDSTVDYIHFIAEKALKIGLLPHINAGILTSNELSIFKEISASVGLMLENVSSRLTQKGMPHAQSPGKHPKIRLRTIKEAGRLKIPFTSGILVGIGETLAEIAKSLFVLKNVHNKYHHLQEVIIQNFKPHHNSNMANHTPASIKLMEKILIIARHILPPEISIQIPPNLISGHETRFLLAGMSDWGGISQITSDYINPDHKWPLISELIQKANQSGYKLLERLPIYPRYINLQWVSPQVLDVIESEKLNTKDGYRKRQNNLSLKR